jgi:hypothetical protein
MAAPEGKSTSFQHLADLTGDSTGNLTSSLEALTIKFSTAPISEENILTLSKNVNKKLTITGTVTAKDFSFLKLFPKLTSLHLDILSMKLCSTDCPNLQVLRIGKAEVSLDLETFTQLYSVEINESLLSLGKLEECKNLVSFKVNRLDKITSIKLPTISSLKTVSITKCAKLTDITGLSNTQMETLNLSGNASLEDVSCLVTCENLKVLNLSECLSLKSLRGMGSCKALMSICVDKCPVLDDIFDLDRCPNLNTIYREGCPSLPKKCGFKKQISELV